MTSISLVFLFIIRCPQVLCWALADGSQTMFGGEARNDKPINALTLNATAGQIITAGADNCVHWTTMPAGQKCVLM